MTDFRKLINMIVEARDDNSIFLSNWIDVPYANSFHANGRGFCNYPGIYLCRAGSNSAYGNHKGGFASREDAKAFADENGLGEEWKITDIKGSVMESSSERIRVVIAVEYDKKKVDNHLGNTPDASTESAVGELLHDWPIDNFEILSVTRKA